MSSSLEPLAALPAAVEESWRELGRAGTWWTGAERLAMAQEARAAHACAGCAERKAALSPYAVDAGHVAGAVLEAAAVDAVHRLATDPGRITQRWFDDLVASGLEPEAAVELVAVVATVAMIDSHDRALGAAERALPAAVAGSPSQARQAGLETSCAWAPTVDPEQAEGMTGMLYQRIAADAGFVFHVARALTSVPDAMQTFFRVFSTAYHTHGETKGSLSRPQVELLAASTSSINECFY